MKCRKLEFEHECILSDLKAKYEAQIKELQNFNGAETKVKDTIQKKLQLEIEE